MSGHEHAWVPLVHLDARIGESAIRWEFKAVAAPRYPFMCTGCDEVIWRNAREARDQGLIRVLGTFTRAGWRSDRG